MNESHKILKFLGSYINQDIQTNSIYMDQNEYL